MDERNKIEQPFEERRSVMKKNKNDKKLFKLEFLKKLPHSIFSHSTVEKTRALFRTSEFKHDDTINNNELILSSNQQHYNVDNSSLSINSIIPSTSIMSTDHIATSSIITQDKINLPDNIDHQLIDLHTNEYRLTSNYFQNKYKQYLKPTLLLPKQYFNDLLHKPNYDYSTIVNKKGLYSRPSLTVSSSNSMHSKSKYPIFNYITMNHPTSSNHLMSITSFNYRPDVCSQSIKTLTDENYQQPTLSILRSLPSSPTLIWNQCVRRLNTEYQLTIVALQQAKENLEQNSSNSIKSVSKCSNLVTHNTKSLWRNERKKPSNVTFCLPLPKESSTKVENYASVNSKKKIERSKLVSPNIVFKPKFIKPIQLNTFSQSLKLESMSSNDENNEKLDSIDKIIKKLNDLNNALSTIKMESPTIIENSNLSSSVIDDTTNNIDIHSKTSIVTGDLRETLDQSLIDLSSSESVFMNNKRHSENFLNDEETKYTVETFYQSIDNNQNQTSSNCQHVVIIEEKTTEEQFNLVNKKQQQTIKTEDISSKQELFNDESNISSYLYSLLNPISTKNFDSDETLSKPLTNKNSSTKIISCTPVNSNNKTSNSLIPQKRNNHSISKIPKHSKTISPSNELRTSVSKTMNNSPTKIPKPIKVTKSQVSSQSPSTTRKQTFTNNSHTKESKNGTNSSTLPLGKNRVKTIVSQINANTSVNSSASSLKINKGTSCSVSTHRKLSTIKNDVKKK